MGSYPGAGTRMGRGRVRGRVGGEKGGRWGWKDGNLDDCVGGSKRGKKVRMNGVACRLAPMRG